MRSDNKRERFRLMAYSNLLIRLNTTIQFMLTSILIVCVYKTQFYFLKTLDNLQNLKHNITIYYYSIN